MKTDEKQMRGRIEVEDRLVGALGGSGGALVLGCLLSYFIVPETWNLPLLLIFEAIGIFLIAMAAIVHLRKEKRKRKALILPAMFLILLLSFPHIAPVFATTSSSMQFYTIPEDIFVIEHSLFKVTIEELLPTHVRLTYAINNSIVYYDILVEGSKVVLFANGTESFRLSIPQAVSSTTTSTSTTTTTYYWDGIRFVEGQYIKYPHPDRDYYGISPFSSWSCSGYKLFHNQIDQATSQALNAGGGAVIGAAIGAIIGLMVGGGAGSVVGAIAGAIITTVLTWVGAVVFLDEFSCMWWWVSKSYVQWFADNALYLYILYVISPATAIAYAMSEFLSVGYLRVGSATFYDAVGAGSPAPPSGGSGGCPYVYTWDGQQYVMDNNLLPASEMSNGADVEDRYMLEQPLVPTYQSRIYSLYSLQIREFEHEHDYFDQVKLLAVDHSSNVNVAVSPYGEILTYNNPAPAISAVDDNGVDVLSQLSSVDGNYYEGYNGSYIILNFGNVNSENAKLVLRTDRPPLKMSIHIQVQDLAGNWTDIATIIPRTYWATDIIDVSSYLPSCSNTELKVRLYFTASHKIDYVGLDTTPQASVKTYEANIISAIHSTQGNVKPLLMKNDQTHAELTPGQQIQLTFLLPNNQNQERTFILYTEGHYSTIAP